MACFLVSAWYSFSCLAIALSKVDMYLVKLPLSFKIGSPEASYPETKSGAIWAICCFNSLNLEASWYVNLLLLDKVSYSFAISCNPDFWLLRVCNSSLIPSCFNLEASTAFSVAFT